MDVILRAIPNGKCASRFYEVFDSIENFGRISIPLEKEKGRKEFQSPSTHCSLKNAALTLGYISLNKYCKLTLNLEHLSKIMFEFSTLKHTLREFLKHCFWVGIRCLKNPGKQALMYWHCYNLDNENLEATLFSFKVLDWNSHKVFQIVLAFRMLCPDLTSFCNLKWI